MTKSRGIGRGGWRDGGRPKGSKNKVKVLAELLPRLEQQDWELPLYRLLRRLHDNTLDEKYRDLLAIQIMPFLHSRPRSDQTAKAPFQMSDAELDETMRAQLERAAGQEGARASRPRQGAQMSEDRRTRWITLLEAEIARRHAETLEAVGGDPRQELLAALEQMGQWIRGTGDWVEPEKVQLSRQVDKWFAENGYYGR